MKRVLSILLAVIMLLSSVPFSGFVGLDMPMLSASAETTGTYGNLYYMEYDSFVVISGCDKSAASVEIPAKINGKPVTSIGSGAFYGCSSLQSITIPDSVDSIGSYAFYNCSSLQEMTLPFVGESRTATDEKGVFGYIFGYSTNSSSGGIYHYYDNGVWYCYYIPTSLRKVTITDANRIPDSAFYNCSMLTDITIPDSVTSIGDWAFAGCRPLASIAIPTSVTSIGERAFYGCNSLKSITIPDSVTNIGYDAFEECSSLESITIPDSVVSIGRNAFGGTAYYNNKDNWENGVLYIGNHLIAAEYDFAGGYTIKNGTKTIAGHAFSGCSSLKSITIPDSVTSIGRCAFLRCRSLQSITIPSSVTSIGDGAFEYCSFKEVHISSIFAWCNISFRSSSANPLSNGAELYLNNNRVENLIIPDGVTAIKDYTFAGFRSLKSITIPDSVTSIGGSAFSGCSSLESITIPDSITSIVHSTFSDCSSLKSIIIPDSVIDIGDDAFYGCSSLQRVTISDSVTSIGQNAFYKCAALKTVNYLGTKDGWEKININTGNKALTTSNIIYGCPHENYITLPAKAATCTEDGHKAYKKCSRCDYTEGFEKIAAGHTLTDIAAKAATCTEKGHKAYKKCTKCDYTEGFEEIKALGHKIVDVPGKAATCTEKGHKAYKKCSKCDYTEGFEKIAAGHTLTNVAAKAATCTEDGHKAYKKCTKCDYTEGYEEIKALGHKIVDVPGYAATCIEKGKSDGKKCFVCDVFTVPQNEIPSNGHTASDWEIKTPATTEAEGLKVKKCIVCGIELESEIIPKLTPAYVLGDINGDGKVTATDARIILRIATRLEKLEDQKVTVFAAADVNGDNKITATDARKVLRVATRLESF